jgi:hypothetical protein
MNLTHQTQQRLFVPKRRLPLYLKRQISANSIGQQAKEHCGIHNRNLVTRIGLSIDKGLGVHDEIDPCHSQLYIAFSWTPAQQKEKTRPAFLSWSLASKI